MVQHSHEVPDAAGSTGCIKQQQRCYDLVGRYSKPPTQSLPAAQRSLAERLRDISETVRFIHSLDSPYEMIRAISERACGVFESHVAIASFAPPETNASPLHTVYSLSPPSGRHETRIRIERSLIYQQVRKNNQTLRLDRSTFRTHPDWQRKFSKLIGSQRPTSGILAAPFVGQDDRNIGIILLLEKLRGDFTADDEAMLTQLAYMAATAIENARLHEAVRETKSWLENILSSITDAFFTIDHDWRLTYMNRAAERLLRRPSHELVGRRLWDAFPGTPSLHLLTKYQEVLSKQQTVEFQEYFPPLGIWMDIRAYPTRDGIAVYARDISEQRKTEAELRALNKELEKRVRERTAELEAANRELAAFSYSVSHDLRAPLRTINGFAQALIEDYRDQLDEIGRDYLQRIQNASRRMGTLIDDLLYLARVSRSELVRQKIDLSLIAAEAVAMLREEHPERQVTVVVQPNLIAYGDPGLLRVAIENLLSNAWKFTAEVPDACIIMGMQHDKLGAGEPVFFVRDNGVGFDMALADRLFQPFERLHPDEIYRGNGIGLATVSRIIQRHGGRIWAEAAVGEGATFYFTVA